MRILVTNDDGINAPGLKIAQQIAHDIAGPDGEVWTVAPAFEQSGVGHKISYTHPFMIDQQGPRTFAAEGAPADCVLAGVNHVLAGQKIDLVLSGVNRGNNAGENTLYSGTLGAAMEGALQGIPAIALSQFIGPKNREAETLFSAAAEHGTATVRALLDKGLWDGSGYRVFYNVNFPPVQAADVRGMQVTTQGYRADGFFGVEPHTSPSGRKYLWIKGGNQHIATEPGTDVAACLDGYTSITPMRANLTAGDAVAWLKDQLE